MYETHLFLLFRCKIKRQQQLLWSEDLCPEFIYLFESSSSMDCAKEDEDEARTLTNSFTAAGWKHLSPDSILHFPSR